MNEDVEEGEEDDEDESDGSDFSRFSRRFAFGHRDDSRSLVSPLLSELDCNKFALHELEREEGECFWTTMSGKFVSDDDFFTRMSSARTFAEPFDPRD